VLTVADEAQVDIAPYEKSYKKAVDVDGHNMTLSIFDFNAVRLSFPILSLRLLIGRNCLSSQSRCRVAAPRRLDCLRCYTAP
jgi:hypothetical protein